MAASGILASMSVVLGAQTSEFDRAMANARRELSGLSKFGERLKGAGEGLSTYVSAPLAALAGLSVKLAGDMEKANVNFEVMLGSAQKATAVLTDLKDFAASTPFEFPEVQDAAKKLLAFNTPASELKTTLRQLGDIAAGVDAPIGEIAEIYGKARVQGRLFQEDINQLTGRGIPIIQELAKQFKVSEGGVRKLVETGKVGFPSIQQAFADLTKEGGKFSGLMEKQSQTLPGLISTVLDSAKGLATDLGTEIVNAFDLKGVLKNLISFTDGLRKSFAELDPSVKRIILGIGGVAIAAGPLLFAAGTLLTMLPALSAGFTLLTGPVGLIAAAIAVAAVAIIANWDDIVAYFTTGEGATVFNELSKAVTESIGIIKSAFNELKSIGLGDLLAGLDTGDFGAFLGELVKGVANGVRGIIEVCSGLVKTVNALFQGEWRDAWDGLLLIADGVLAPLGIKIRNATEPYRNYIQSAAAENAVWAKSFSAFGGPLRDYGSGILTAAEATDLLSASSEEATGKAAAVAAVNEKQVAALAKLREELRQNELRYQALGDSYDVVGGKQRILQSGIENLISVGFRPLGRTVQGFVGQLLEIPKAVDQIDTPLTEFLDKIAKAAEKQQVKEFNPIGGITVPPLPVLTAPSFDTTPLTASVDTTISELTRLRDAQLTAEMFTEGMNQALVTGLQNVAVGFGEAIGQIISGSAGLEALPAAVLGAVGTMAVQLGQLAIGTGIAVAGIKKALETLNPAVAIAGGIALVALGTAVKGAAARIGGGGRGSSTPSGGGGGVTPRVSPVRPEPMKVEVIVTGKLRGEGADLVAIISKDAYRQQRVG